ncbi:cation channel sperm-associated auxiliary subunit delta [Malaclemys terrapin pileata]|uniref:cation channel sperm-associated auxiliary subunit delta n=1 Tax=Malaclemys terrapin pileata TaxID=2991368 RepID=UPI0023A8CA83|nr:cation channel sperm-associated auxiliary subunit delta [Malaclemys terrapin pileata]
MPYSWPFSLAELWLWLRFAIGNTDSWSCTNERLVYSGRSFSARDKVSGTVLSFTRTEPSLLQYPCNGGDPWGRPSPALYLGQKVFLSTDGFETSLLPLTIPSELETSNASVSAAAFVKKDRLVMVINGQVYLYLFIAGEKEWLPVQGIDSLVTELSNTHCCYPGQDPACQDTSLTIFAYETGHSASESNIFLSEDGGYIFTALKLSPELQGVLLGVYNFVSLSQTGLLINRTHSDGEGKGGGAYFSYTGGNMSHMYSHISLGFHLKSTGGPDVWGIQNPFLWGFTILWTKDTLLISPNNGLLVEPVTVQTKAFPRTSRPFPGDGLCHVATSNTEIAALTRDHRLFHGSLDMVSTTIVQIRERNSSEKGLCNAVLMFDKVGMLTILSPEPTSNSWAYNFQKCTLNIQLLLMELWPPLQDCPVEILKGHFHNKIHYIDMHQKLNFSATFVPKPGTGAFPMVTVSNPHVLGFQAYITEDGYTYDGNTKYSLHMQMLQQCFSGMAEPHFSDTFLSGGMSVLTVDIPNKGPSCIDMHPLSALINVGCPPTKHIKVLKNTTACSKGLFNQGTLQDNFTYTISHNLYDPNFLATPQLGQSDLEVLYEYNELGCPLLLYYDTPWLPILELWENDAFVEYVAADFVVFEVNGMYNYDYLLTAAEANCISQPQNWTALMQKQDSPNPSTAWSRMNYESCKNHDGPKLVSPSAKYQILGQNEKNRIVFSHYNGFYIFKAIVVDKLYSHCELSATVSVYVTGALPKSYIHAWTMLMAFLTIILIAILMGYFLHKLSLMKKSPKVKVF